MADDHTKPIAVYGQEIEVLPSDIDVQNHANNVCYVYWMQDIAVKHSAQLGWDAQRYAETGACWVVRRHTIDYLVQAFLGDRLLAETWVAEMKNVSSVRRYRFTRLSDNVVVAKAETRWGFVDMHTGRPTRVPPAMHEIFQIVVGDNPESAGPT